MEQRRKKAPNKAAALPGLISIVFVCGGGGVVGGC